ncbi:MAG: DnaJ domain-containing protein [Thermoanaerobaculia bacterium]
MAKNYYDILGLPRNATTQQVRDRFRTLARELHPDRFQGEEKSEAEARFQEITQAFNVLNDAGRRRDHDLELARPDGLKQDESEAARVYLQRGIKAFRDKQYSQAAENFDRATRENPESAQSWHYLAMACRGKKQWLPRARDAILKACDIDPMNAVYLRLAGEIFAESGMHRRAKIYYQKALTWGGDDPEIRSALDQLERASPGGASLFGRGS